MKYFVICFVAALCITPWASASTICASGSLADYEALGAAGCMIGTNTVSNFNVLNGITGATAIAPASIEITTSGSTAMPTLVFSVSETASNGMLLEGIFNYMISGNSYTADSIALAGTSSSGNGAVTDIQNYCLGGSFDSTGVSGCSSGKTNGLVVLGDGTDSASYAPVSFVSVTDDFTLDSGGSGAGNIAAGGSLTDSFQATGVTPEVPEPSTLLFGATGLAGILIFRKNQKMQKQETRRKAA